MEFDTFTAFDITVLVLIGLSTLFAFGRGFATVALSFGAWAGAFVASIFGFELLQPYGRDLISPPELADLITLVTLFFVTLFALKQLAELIGGSIRESTLGFLDRSLGALFGLLRGMVIVSIVYLGFAKLYPGQEQPDWVSDAKTKPLVAWGAEMMEGLAAEALGKDPTEVGKEYIEKASQSVESQFMNEKLEEQAAKYMKDQRKNLDKLFKDVVKEEKEKEEGSN